MKIKGKTYRRLIAISHARFRVICPDGILMDLSLDALYDIKNGHGQSDMWIHGPVQILVTDPYRNDVCEMGHEITPGGGHIHLRDMNAHYAKDNVSPWQITVGDITSAYPDVFRPRPGVFPTCELGHPTRIDGSHIQDGHYKQHLPQSGDQS